MNHQHPHQQPQQLDIGHEEEIIDEEQMGGEEYYEEFIEVDEQGNQIGGPIYHLEGDPTQQLEQIAVDQLGNAYVSVDEMGNAQYVVEDDPHQPQHQLLEQDGSGQMVRVVRAGPTPPIPGGSGTGAGGGGRQTRQQQQQQYGGAQYVGGGVQYVGQPQGQQPGTAHRMTTRYGGGGGGGRQPSYQQGPNGTGAGGMRYAGQQPQAVYAPTRRVVYATGGPSSYGGGGGRQTYRAGAELVDATGEVKASPVLRPASALINSAGGATPLAFGSGGSQRGSFTSFTGGSILSPYGSTKSLKPRKSSAKKKPCNCTKSMCLKLYCECFANGEFCLDCNCRQCHNNLEHEQERSRAIKSSLERNPSAFKPKIGVSAKTGRNLTEMERLHSKGCHCKKSNCLKNYCECYEAKVPCTDRCKCCSCRNTEEDRHHKFKDKFAGGAGGLAQLAAVAAADARSGTPFSDDESDAGGGVVVEASNPKSQPWFYMTDDVVEGITTCMVAQAHEFESQCTQEGLEQCVLKEFGRCLEQIIENANTAAAR